MNSIPIQLSYRRDPICPGCYCRLTGANTWIFMDQAWCVDCMSAHASDWLIKTAAVLASRVDPMDRSACRGITAYTPNCVSSVSLLLAYDVEDRPAPFDPHRFIVAELPKNRPN